MTLSYDSIASDYAIHRAVHPNLLRNLAEYCEVTPPARVLEVGCGTGNYVASIASMTAAKCSGIDPSLKMLNLARQKTTSVSWFHGSGESLPFPDGSFDFIYSVDVIHHVRDRQAFYREAFRVLTAGRWLVTATDSEDTIRNRVPLSSYFPETIEPEIQRYPGKGEIPQWMSSCGFQELSEQSVEFSYFLSDPSAFERKTFSCLHLIPDDAFTKGLARLKHDLQRGPLACTSRYVFYRARKP